MQLAFIVLIRLTMQATFCIHFSVAVQVSFTVLIFVAMRETFIVTNLYTTQGILTAKKVLHV